MGVGQVVADLTLMVEELGGDHCANGVTSEILGSGVTPTVPVEPGERFGAALFQFGAEDVQRRHGISDSEVSP